MGHLPPSKPADPGDVQELVRRATGHRLGRGFLLDGSLDAVAATFGVHAFVVDAARESIRGADGVGSRADAWPRSASARRRGELET